MCYSLRPRLFSDPIASVSISSSSSPDSEPSAAASAPAPAAAPQPRGETVERLRSSDWLRDGPPAQRREPDRLRDWQPQQNGGERQHGAKRAAPEKPNKNWDRLRAEEKEAEREAKKVSKYIDKILKEQKREYKQTHRLLLLGKVMSM
ncbi:hypothetical protein chiPu_0016759 [Chiloscyllium punctatum]|uniref:Uncharacterized protein n=1 Tax=Chiloscyllium punctatum TaxID=137246 RepID=A0A401T6G2_CHIPU|nr:hypothetical protein [Chiloscyllium punctatum]